MNKIIRTIKESREEFNRKWKKEKILCDERCAEKWNGGKDFEWCDICRDNFVRWLANSQKALLQAILEGVEEMEKDEGKHAGHEISENTWCHACNESIDLEEVEKLPNQHYNKALSDIKGLINDTLKEL